MSGSMPFGAHGDNVNQQFSIIGVVGTLGTADTGGTAKTLPIGVDPTTGAQYVYNLAPAGSVGSVSVAPNLPVIAGTPADPGTALIVRLTDGTNFYNAGASTVGTFNNISTGTQQTLGTVGVLNSGTLTTIPNTPGGTLGLVTTVTNLTSGSVRMTVGTLTTGTLQSLGTAVGVGTLTNVGQVYNAGTVQNILAGTIGTILGIGGTVAVSGAGGGVQYGEGSTIGTATGNAIVFRELGGTLEAVGTQFPLPVEVLAGTTHLNQSGGNLVVNVSNFAIGQFGATDALANNLTSALTFSEELIYNGATFDRTRSGTSAVGGLGTGVLGALVLGTDSGGTIRAPLVNAAGAMSVSGASAGTFNNITTGTQQTLGTVGTVTGVGVVTTLTSLSGGTISNILAGTVGTVTGVGVVTTVTNLSNGTIQSSGTTTGVGVVTTLGSQTNLGQVYNAGTVQNILGGTIGTVTGVGTVANIGSIGMLNAGTVVIASGTVTSLASGTTIGTINAGTINVGTFQINPIPATKTITSAGTTTAGTIGTLIAAPGAGTAIYITGFHVLTNSGTVETVLSFGLQAAGNQVVSRGLFPAGGGITEQKTFPNTYGATGTALTWNILSTAGTVDLHVDYFTN